MNMIEFLPPLALTFFLTIFLGKIFIAQIIKMEYGQNIRVEGPESHHSKAGTPTMGGVFLVTSSILASLIFLDIDIDLLLIIFLTIAFGLVGFIDDYLKIIKKGNLGLTSRQKFSFQILVALIFSFLYFCYIGDTSLNLIINNNKISLGYFYYFFMIFILVGTTNAVNLTDGLDGLLAGIASIVFLAFGLIAFIFANHNIAGYSFIMAVASFAFLLLNSHPAKIFMGDTGSLALGGTLAGIAIVLKVEIMLVFIGLIFVIETLSVILQVYFFKRRGIRIFKMSPIHHHFELSGWSEWKVVLSFWLFTYITAFISLVLLFAA